MEPMFTYKCGINKNTLKQIEKIIIPPGALCLANTCIGFFCIVSLFFLVAGSPSLAFSYFWPAVLIYAEKAIGLKIIMKRMLGEKSEDLRFTLSFYDAYFTISGDKGEKELDMPYSRITRVAEVKQHLVFFTKENMCYPILKEVQEPEKTEWFMLLREKNKKIKFQNIKMR